MLGMLDTQRRERIKTEDAHRAAATRAVTDAAATHLGRLERLVATALAKAALPVQRDGTGFKNAHGEALSAADVVTVLCAAAEGLGAAESPAKLLVGAAVSAARARALEGDAVSPAVWRWAARRALDRVEAVASMYQQRIRNRIAILRSARHRVTEAADRHGYAQRQLAAAGEAAAAVVSQQLSAIQAQEARTEKSHDNDDEGADAGSSSGHAQ